jgi:hypothetical protein
MAGENVTENKIGASNNTSVVIMICSLLICMVLFACMMILAAIYRSEIPIVKNYFPAITPTNTTVPHILVHTPSDNWPTLIEDFTTNQNNWNVAYYYDSKVEVKNGKLFIESFDRGIAMATCACKRIEDVRFNNTYYLQADLSPEKPTSKNYGLAFSIGIIDNYDSFYEFSINPRQGRYYLQKQLGDDWIDLLSGSSKMIKTYPETNTLSVYFDHGSIELFINGEKITTYIDNDPINTGAIGFIANDSYFKLVVDNLFAYNKK